MSSYVGISPKGPRDYTGPNVYYPSVVVRNRRPTGADYRQPETGKLYAIGGYWIISIDPTTGSQGELWYLSKIAANVAYWEMLSGGSSGPLINIVVPNGVSPIDPDGSGTINFTSSGGTISITGSSASPNNHTINFDLSGGSMDIDSVQVQAVTAPGVNPVVPDVTGLLNVNGAVVANHSVVLETRSRAVNTFNLEIQYASSAAATDGTKSGVAHFNSAEFSVDASGFVSLAGGGIALDSIGVDATSGGGTNPVLPTAGGLITTNGALVAAGTNPIRTVSTAANVYQIQAQTAQAIAATDASKVGLSSYNSAQFSVDANGFVSASGTGIATTITGDEGGALSPSGNNWNILGLSGSKTSGSGATLTVKSPPFSQVGSSATSSLNSGEFVTAAVTRTLPASAGLADGELIIFSCTTAGALVIQAVGTQKIRLGNQLSSAAGSLSSTAIGDSVSIRFDATQGFWMAVSVIGTWTVA